MRIAFDARAWQKPPHSFRRVLDLLAGAADSAGWSSRFLVTGQVRPEYERQRERIRLLDSVAAGAADGEVLWSPELDCLAAEVPRVATLHDVNPLLADGRSMLSRWFRGRAFHGRVSRRGVALDCLVTDTLDARDRILESFPGLGLEPMVVPLYADTPYRQVAAEQVRSVLRRLSLADGYFLFVGSFRRHKNWQGLIRAYALLPEAVRREHSLVMVGSARRVGGELAGLVRRLGVGECVHTPGQVADADLPALYSGALAFVFPSYLEGFGLPPLEALACGTPVVSSNRTSLPEVLGAAALYVDPDDLASLAAAMLRVAHEPSLRDDLARAGIERAAQFSPRRTARAMSDVFAQMGLAGSRRRN